MPPSSRSSTSTLVASAESMRRLRSSAQESSLGRRREHRIFQHARQRGRHIAEAIGQLSEVIALGRDVDGEPAAKGGALDGVEVRVTWPVAPAQIDPWTARRHPDEDHREVPVVQRALPNVELEEIRRVTPDDKTQSAVLLSGDRCEATEERDHVDRGFLAP